MLRIVESREITKFCYHGGRNDQADAPQCLIRPEHRKLTGEPITITARKVLTFKPSTVLKSAINNEIQNF